MSLWAAGTAVATFGCLQRRAPGRGPRRRCASCQGGHALAGVRALVEQIAAASRLEQRLFASIQTRALVRLHQCRISSPVILWRLHQACCAGGAMQRIACGDPGVPQEIGEPGTAFADLADPQTPLNLVAAEEAWRFRPSDRSAECWRWISPGWRSRPAGRAGPARQPHRQDPARGEGSARPGLRTTRIPGAWTLPGSLLRVRFTGRGQSFPQTRQKEQGRRVPAAASRPVSSPWLHCGPTGHDLQAGAAAFPDSRSAAS